jgi:starch phosphorylase
MDEHVGEDWELRVDDPQIWDKVLGFDDGAVWRAHSVLKGDLLTFLREHARERWIRVWKEASRMASAGTLLSPEPLTIGFARRFARYKRADLLFQDEDRLRRLLTDSQRPVQIVFSGKAHPADDGAKEVLQRVWRATCDPRFEGRIAFLEDYDLHTAHRLVQGVDLWLNLPRVPLEASGTSGMKAALNGVPQLSTLDGWWVEGFVGDNGWAVPLANGSEEEVDRQDHDAIFTILEREIVPLYYDRDRRGVPHGWVRVMKQAIKVAASQFTTRRMVQEYARDFYAPALRGDGGPADPPAGLS